MMRVRDPWLAVQMDNAVSYTGIVIENALQERVEMGDKSVAKYKLSEVLSADFRLPPQADDDDDLMMLIGAEGIVYDEVG